MSRSFREDYLKGLNQPEVMPVPGTQATPAGIMQLYGDTVAPAGYVLCDGTAYDSVTNPEYAPLYAAIGNRFGGSDGTDFQVPDMRGMVAKGAGVNGTHEQARGGGNYFDGGNVGDYQADSVQSHYHNDTINYTLGANAGYPNSVTAYLASGPNTIGVVAAGLVAEGQPIKSGGVTAPSTHTVYGSPRAEYETKPATISFNYIMKL
jgi:microcystin-dependent protein